MKIGATFGFFLTMTAAFGGAPQTPALITTPIGETSVTLLGQPNVVPPNPLVRTYTIFFPPEVKSNSVPKETQQ